MTPAHEPLGRGALRLAKGSSEIDVLDFTAVELARERGEGRLAPLLCGDD